MKSRIDDYVSHFNLRKKTEKYLKKTGVTELLKYQSQWQKWKNVLRDFKTLWKHKFKTVSGLTIAANLNLLHTKINENFNSWVEEI